MHDDPTLGMPRPQGAVFFDNRNRFALPMSATVAADGSASLTWQSALLSQRTAFNHTTARLEAANSWDFPNVYGGAQRALPMQITPLGDRAVRIRLEARSGLGERLDPGILAEPASDQPAADWQRDTSDDETIWRGPCGSVRLQHKPWQVELRDANDRVVWSTWTHAQAKADSLWDRQTTPTMAVRRDRDHRWQTALAWPLQPGEVLVGGGESFSALNKRGQTLYWTTCDPHGTQSQGMYKPVPFLISSEGYGILCHTTATMTADLGDAYHGAASVQFDDDIIDVIVFLGSPAEILASYGALAGTSPVPPLWSFGLWMSRITYDNEAQVREVASRLRDERVPCDVIHLDTGWFERDWCCDYQFSATRFDDPAVMLSDLKHDGYTVSLWQLPYYTPINPLFEQVVDGLAITDGDGNLPTGDAIADFSNPATVDWFQDQLAPLLKLGVGAIKVDFGEGAPISGQYASGQSGRYEHNRYPLRYQAAVFDVTLRETSDSIIWARAGWAGCQRYPLHWGGDAESTDQGLASSVRGGLSLGMCGFSFWSHDAGGFTKRPDAELYLRWLAAGVLGSHVRTHGQPPREPWTYDDAGFSDQFRAIVELRYQLIPYLWTQAGICAAAGQPLMRAMLLDNPDLPEAWPLEDQYRLGHDLLVAPLLRAHQTERRVWLPPGGWVDWFTGTRYDQPGWVTLSADRLPVILLARQGSAIPVAPVAQHTGAIDWSAITVQRFADASGQASGWLRRADAAEAEAIS